MIIMKYSYPVGARHTRVDIFKTETKKTRPSDTTLLCNPVFFFEHYSLVIIIVFGCVKYYVPRPALLLLIKFNI